MALAQGKRRNHSPLPFAMGERLGWDYYSSLQREEGAGEKTSAAVEAAAAVVAAVEVAAAVEAVVVAATVAVPIHPILFYRGFLCRAEAVPVHAYEKWSERPLQSQNMYAQKCCTERRAFGQKSTQTHDE